MTPRPSIRPWPAILVLAIPLSSSLSGAVADPPSLDDLAWMAGSWSSTEGGVETEEHWLPPKGGIMLGVNRTTRGKAPATFEFLRIAARPTGLVYLAQPRGGPATEFPLKESAGRRVVFENPGHDFPRRILYRLDDRGRLVARIEGEIRGEARSKEWTWDRAKATPEP